MHVYTSIPNLVFPFFYTFLFKSSCITTVFFFFFFLHLIASLPCIPTPTRLLSVLIFIPSFSFPLSLSCLSHSLPLRSFQTFLPHMISSLTPPPAHWDGNHTETVRGVGWGGWGCHFYITFTLSNGEDVRGCNACYITMIWTISFTCHTNWVFLSSSGDASALRFMFSFLYLDIWATPVINHTSRQW